MAQFDGSLARTLDFGETGTAVGPVAVSGRAGLRLAPAPARLHGPDKYGILEHRRRQAQIAARRLLDLMEA
jgi:hypothetical protein